MDIQDEARRRNKHKKRVTGRWPADEVDEVLSSNNMAWHHAFVARHVTADASWPLIRQANFTCESHHVFVIIDAILMVGASGSLEVTWKVTFTTF